MAKVTGRAGVEAFDQLMTEIILYELYFAKMAAQYNIQYTGYCTISHCYIYWTAVPQLSISSSIHVHAVIRNSEQFFIDVQQCNRR